MPTTRFSFSCSHLALPLYDFLETFWKAETKWEPRPRPTLRSRDGTLRKKAPSGWTERPLGTALQVPLVAVGFSDSELIFLTSWRLWPRRPGRPGSSQEPVFGREPTTLSTLGVLQ